jgi:hypothetical protein
MVGVLRGCLFAVISPIFAIILGIAIGRDHGFWYGLLAGLGAMTLAGIIAAIFMNSGGKLTIADCIMPTILSIISGIVFAPLQLLEGSFFSSATCIMSGVLFSIGLWLHKVGRMSGPWLIFPLLTFVYEMLPIELPSDMDNLFAFGGSCFSIYFGRIRLIAQDKDDKVLLDNPDSENNVDVVSDAIDVVSEVFEAVDSNSSERPIVRRRKKKAKSN